MMYMRTAEDPAEIYALVDLFPLCLYHGDKGNDLKKFFYVFYPVHLILLYIVALFLVLLD